MTALDLEFSKMIMAGVPLSPINEYRTLREIYTFCDDRHKYFEMTRPRDSQIEAQARQNKNIELVLVMGQRKISRQLYAACLSHVEGLWQDILVKGLRPIEFGDMVREQSIEGDYERATNTHGISMGITPAGGVALEPIP